MFDDFGDFGLGFLAAVPLPPSLWTGPLFQREMTWRTMPAKGVRNHRRDQQPRGRRGQNSNEGLFDENRTDVTVTTRKNGQS